MFRDNVFCFDNEAFRFLCVSQKKVKFEESDIEEINKSWEISVKETFRLIDKIKKLAPHRTEETLDINNIRRLIFTFARALAKLQQDLQTNVKLINQTVSDIESLEVSVAKLKNSPETLKLVCHLLNYIIKISASISRHGAERSYFGVH